jgi:hypothetical protein
MAGGGEVEAIFRHEARERRFLEGRRSELAG